MSPEAVFVNIGNKIVFVNQAAVRLFGARNKKELLGISPFELFHPDYHPRMRERKRQLLAGKAVPLAEARALRLDGTVVEVEVAASVFMDRNRRVIQVLVRDITERKEIEEVFARQSAQLETIFDSVPAMIFYKDKKNRLLRVNRSFADTMGVPKQELESKSLFDLYPKEQAQAYWRDDLEVISSGKPKINIIESMETKKGNVWLETNKIPHRDLHGNIIGVIGFAIDITARKESEAIIKNSLQRFTLLAQTADELLRSPDAQKIIDSLCKKVLEYLDCQVFFNFLIDEKAGLLRLNAYSGITPEEAAKLEWLDHGNYICGSVIRSGQPILAEYILETGNPLAGSLGSYAIKAYACYPLLASGEKIIGTLSFGTRTRDTFSENDLSLMKAVANQVAVAINRVNSEKALQKSYAELERRVEQRTKELADERQRLYAVLEALPVYVILLTPDYHVSFANKFFRERFGDDRGRPCFEYLFKRDKPCENCQSYNVLKTKEPLHWEWTGPDGRNYDIYDFPFKETDGSLHIMEMGIDITEHRRAEEALFTAEMEVERAKRLSDIGTLAATVAHELRNPLATMNMAVNNIRRKMQNNLLNTHLSNIENKISESEQIINNLLFYSRLRPPHLEGVDIYGILQECAAAVQSQSKKKFSLNVDLNPSRGVSIEADPLQIKEVFNNILDNAYDAILDGEGRIEVAARDKGNAVEIMVEDNGAGITKKDLDKVFNPFFTTKAKGTGLGLPVCRQIIEMHAGTISLESKEGKGTRAVITLPKKRRRCQVNES